MKTKVPYAFLIAFLALTMIFSAVYAVDNIHLHKYVISNGGGTLQAGLYSMTSTVAQPEAQQQFQGGAYQLSGGFWHTGNSGYGLYLPCVVK